MKTFGVTDYTNLAPESVADGRTDGRSGPTTRPAFDKATQVKMINKICTALELSTKEIHLLESFNKSHT